MIVLDTDHLSILQHDDSTSGTELRRRLEIIADEEIVTTVVTYEEQMRSWLSQIGRHSDVSRQIPFYNRLIQFAEFYSEWQLLPLTKDAAKAYKLFRKQKVRISSTDLKIASIVLNYDAKLLSRNLADFKKVPDLTVENWLTA